MNPLIKLQLFIRDLISHPESKIKRGRVNFVQADFETDYIVVDGIGQAVTLSRSEKFDPVEEIMTLSRRMSKPCTIDFYGAAAFTNSDKFVAMMGSELARDLQETIGVTVGSVSNITDVKALTGQQYGERLQLSLNMQYNISTAISTLRIDETQLEFHQG